MAHTGRPPQEAPIFRRCHDPLTVLHGYPLVLRAVDDQHRIPEVGHRSLWNQFPHVYTVDGIGHQLGGRDEDRDQPFGKRRLPGRLPCDQV